MNRAGSAGYALLAVVTASRLCVTARHRARGMSRHAELKQSSFVDDELVEIAQNPGTIVYMLRIRTSVSKRLRGKSFNGFVAEGVPALTACLKSEEGREETFAESLVLSRNSQILVFVSSSPLPRGDALRLATRVLIQRKTQLCYPKQRARKFRLVLKARKLDGIDSLTHNCNYHKSLEGTDRCCSSVIECIISRERFNGSSLI